MADDLANLGYSVDTRGLMRGEKAMKSYAETGRKMEQSVIRSVSNINKSFASLNKATKLAQKSISSISTAKASKETNSFTKGLISLEDEIKRIDRLKISPTAFDSSSINRSEAALRKYGATGEKANRKIIASTKDLKDEFITLKGAIGLVSSGLAAIGLANLARDVTEYSDTWKGLNSQIRQVTDSEESLISTREKLFRLSKETRSEFDATVKLFSEMKRSTDDLGLSTERQLGITRTLNNLFVSGGRPLSEINGAIIQLTQGFAAGALRGDEFNSVAENAPRIMDALSNKLHMTRGELREFAATGGITAKILTDSLEDYSMTAQKLADQTEKTFGQNLQAAESNVISFIGQSESLNGAIGSIGSTIEDLSEDIGALADSGKALIAVVGVGLTPVMFGYASSLATTTKAQLLSGTTATVTSNAFGTVTRTAATATIATNALGIATKFLLGSWGLLLTAVGTAAAVFITSKDETDDLTRSIAEQEDAVARLTLEYKDNTAAQLTNALVRTSKSEIDFLNQKFEIESKLNAFGSKSTQSAEFRTGLEGQLSSVNDQLQKLGVRSTAARNMLNNLFDAGMKNIEWTNEKIEADKKAALEAKKLLDAEKAYAKWLDTITGFRTPLQSVTDEIAKVNKAIAGGLPVTENVASKLADLSASLAKFNESAEQSTAYDDWIQKIEDSVNPIKKLRDEITETWLAIDDGDVSFETGIKFINNLEDEIKSLDKTLSNSEIFSGIADSANEALTAIQGLSEQGSKSYEKLGVAIQAVTVAQKISQIEASATMAAITGGIGAVLGLVGMLGSLGGSIEDESAGNQAAQGLSMWGDKASSIDDAVTTTASASDKLVGINTGMLKALQSLQAGISGAAGISARGISGAEFGFQPDINKNPLSILTAEGLFGKSGINKVLDIAGGASLGASIGTMIMPGVGTAIGAVIGLFGSGIAKAIGKLLGGSSKVVDSGVKIMGGALVDMLDGASVFAFETTKSKKYFFSSSKRKTELVAIAEAGDQFGLVFSSLADSVFEGGKALGLSTSELEKSINEFNIATTTISLKGLSIEKQEEAIEAVFSRIFNGLASATIPFLSEFQKTGEELGVTLSRLATEVQIADFAVKNFGIDLGDKLANPEMYARIADNLTMLTGGLEEFANKTASFVDNFAPESVKFKINSDAFTAAMTSVGLEVPKTKEAFFELMESLKVDPANVAGWDSYLESIDSVGLKALATRLRDAEISAQALSESQIATLLNTQDVAKNYYGLLEDAEEKRLSDASQDLAARLALDSKSASMQIQLMRLQGMELEALALQRQIELSATDDSLKALKLSIFAQEDLNKAEEGRLSIIEKQQSELEAFNKSLMSLSDSLRGTVSGIYGVSAAAASTSLDVALQAARIGDFSKALNLDTSGFKLEESSFSSLSEFNIAQADVANRLIELADLTGNQATIEDLMLTEAQQQTALLTSINSSYIPQDTQTANNVIMMDEIKALREEMKSSTEYQKKTAENTKTSATNSTGFAVNGMRTYS